MITDYDSALKYIHGRPRLQKEKPSSRMNNLMKKLGNPENDLNIIHVAGTNGKGSCVSYLINMFQAAKVSVGSFTSPFMIKFNERIRVNGVPLSDQEIFELTREVSEVVDEIDQDTPNLGPTEFEIDTAMMFLYFSEHPVDVVIVEAGIGGRSDATNLLRPKLSIITTIGMDHMKLLGNTEELIAADKAGIIKEEIPSVIGNISKEPRSVIEDRATDMNSKLYEMGRDYSFIMDDQKHFNFKSGDVEIANIETNMIGKFEMEDAAIAIQAFLIYSSRYLNISSTSHIIRRGIKETNWIGRMEMISKNPPILIDGAHNVPAVKRLVKEIPSLYQKPITVIMAAFADKQYHQMVEILKQLPDVKIILTTFNPLENRKVADFDSFERDSEIRVENDWQKAILDQIDNDKHLILITGSLLFISDVRKFLLKMKK